MSNANEYVSSNTGKFLAIGAAVFLIVGGCTLCGGGLAVPFVLKRRAAEMQRAEAERHRQQVEEVLRKKAADDDAQRQIVAPADGDTSQSRERE